MYRPTAKTHNTCDENTHTHPPSMLKQLLCVLWTTLI